MLRPIQLIVLSISISLSACNSLDKPASHEGARLFVPTDTRSVDAALRALPAISGGTLAVSPGDAYAVAADPDRDRISIVTLSTGDVQELALERGDEPGRVAIDAQLHAYVALRGAGDLISVDIQNAALLQRSHVCSAPRGIALDAPRALVHVACADGRLVSLNADGETVRDIDLGTDLRDVVVRDRQLVVSTFKGATVLTVDTDGSVIDRVQPDAFQLESVENLRDGSQKGTIRSFGPQLAWRMVPANNDPSTMLMLHQGASTDQVDVDKKPDDMLASNGGSASAYGGGSDAQCSGIVSTNVTRVDASGHSQTFALAGATLAVDLTISPMTGEVMIAEAGTADPKSPRPFVVQTDDEGSSSSGGFSGPVGIPRSSAVGSGLGRILRLASTPTGQIPNNGPGMIDPQAACQPPEVISVPGQPTAVAFTSQGQLIVQSREPALVLVAADGLAAGSLQPRTVDLGGGSALDTGHELFHRDSGGGIACASCHGEGAEDGHTWVFSDVGARRTQALNVGLAGTAPFHWNGDLPDVGTLMERVFVGRMGGVHQNAARTKALTNFLFALKPPAPIVAADDAAAMRGKSLFDSSEVGCSSCHAGAKFTNNKSYDVGTSKAGERLQVPSLRGVGYRAPFLHTGCAETLRARFDPSCGGTSHGHTSGLDDGQIDDLIAYLRSI